MIIYVLVHILVTWTMNVSSMTQSKYIQPRFRSKKHELLENTSSKLIVGYANWNQCDDLLIKAVKEGVNVLIWFSINLSIDANGKPIITNGPDLDCARKIITQIREMNLPTIHLISIGGWNSPHPDTTNSVEYIYETWKNWNNDLFDGFDWDIEGNDDFDSPYNQFTSTCLDYMGQISQLAKRDGYIVTMAPAESYLDPTTSNFDYDVNHTYSEWDPIVPNFKYHGHNTYAYLLKHFGTTVIDDLRENTMNSNNSDKSDFSTSESTSVEEPMTSSRVVNTFDLIIIQLYEGYSHIEYHINHLHQSPQEYIHQWINSLYKGWKINFPPKVSKLSPTLPTNSITTSSSSSNSNPHIILDTNTCTQTATSSSSLSSSSSSSSTSTENYDMTTIRILPTQLIIGLANGWAGDGKFLLLYPEEVEEIYTYLTQNNLQPRGFAFWNIKDEGIASIKDPLRPVWMANGLNKFLHTR